MGAACKIYCVINPDADQSLLAFIRSVVQSYLHIDEIVPGPSFWKMKVVLHDSNQLTGHSHWPTTRETAKMCPPWLLKSSSHLLWRMRCSSLCQRALQNLPYQEIISFIYLLFLFIWCWQIYKYLVAIFLLAVLHLLTKQSQTPLNNLVPWGYGCMFKISPTDH